MRIADMKTSFLVSVVAGAHCVAIGSAVLIQGCGTTRGPITMPTETPMPPTIATERVVATPVENEIEPEAAVLAPEVKKWTTGKTTTYVIGKGDSLSKIAARYGVTVAEIMTLNNMSNPDKIQSGQKLVLPGEINLENPVIKTTSKKVTTPAAPAGSNAYTVQPGDCLSVIAAKAGVTTKALREANGIKGDNIMVGQSLVIPGGNVIPRTPKAPVVPKNTAVVPEVSLPDVHIVDELPLADLEPENATVPSAAVSLYTVKAGDDILSVVSEHNVSIAELRRVNRLSSDLLVPGQKLVIPTQD